MTSPNVYVQWIYLTFGFRYVSWERFAIFDIVSLECKLSEASILDADLYPDRLFFIIMAHPRQTEVAP